MRQRSKQWALVVAAAVFLGQLIGAVHSREAQAAAEDNHCAVCQISHEINSVENKLTTPSLPTQKKADVPLEGIDLLPIQEIQYEKTPRVPPALISL